MRNTMLFKTNFTKILDTFWITEDIKELIPNCECKYLDNDYQLLSISSKTLFTENDLKPVFRLYRITFSPVNSIRDKSIYLKKQLSENK